MMSVLSRVAGSGWVFGFNWGSRIGVCVNVIAAVLKAPSQGLGLEVD